MLLVMIALVACQTAVPASTSEPPQKVQDFFNAAWGERDVFRANLVPSEQGILDDLPGATEYHIEFTIADDLDLLRGMKQSISRIKRTYHWMLFTFVYTQTLWVVARLFQT